MHGTATRRGSMKLLRENNNVGCRRARLAVGAALGSFRTYVGLLRYNFAAKRPNYLPTQLPSAASGRKTYLPTYLPIRRPPRKNLPTVPTFYSHF